MDRRLGLSEPRHPGAQGARRRATRDADHRSAGLSGRLVGDVDAGPEMHFSFFDLIAHVTRTRGFTAGTILGGGTVSNADPARGFSCIAEVRARETIAGGQPKTPFMKAGDTVAIEMLD